MHDPNELKWVQELQSKVDPVRNLRETGKRVIATLADYIGAMKAKYPEPLQCLTIKERKETQLTPEFFSIKMLVRAEIPLSMPPSEGEIKSRIIAYLLPEKETDKPTQLKICFNFDELGNVKDSEKGWQAVDRRTFQKQFAGLLVQLETVSLQGAPPFRRGRATVLTGVGFLGPREVTIGGQSRREKLASLIGSSR